MIIDEHIKDLKERIEKIKDMGQRILNQKRYIVIAAKLKNIKMALFHIAIVP